MAVRMSSMAVRMPNAVCALRSSQARSNTHPLTPLKEVERIMEEPKRITDGTFPLIWLNFDTDPANTGAIILEYRFWRFASNFSPSVLVELMNSRAHP